MNQSVAGSFEKRDSLMPYNQNRIPFKRALFDNPENIRLSGYPSYVRHKPLRTFITSLIKEFENQLRILFKYKGRLKCPVQLSDEIVSICKAYAQRAVNGEYSKQNVEITIDREKLMTLIQDSDDVRKRLLEGNFEYGSEPELEDIDNQDKNEMIIASMEDAIAIAAVNTKNNFLPNVSPIQQNILDFLLNNGGSGTSTEINAAFPGIFIGVEIDRINDIALETISDLLIGFEDELWYIMEDYINEL